MARNSARVGSRRVPDESLKRIHSVLEPPSNIIARIGPAVDVNGGGAISSDSGGGGGGGGACGGGYCWEDQQRGGTINTTSAGLDSSVTSYAGIGSEGARDLSHVWDLIYYARDHPIEPATDSDAPEEVARRESDRQVTDK